MDRCRARRDLVVLLRALGLQDDAGEGGLAEDAGPLVEVIEHWW